MKSPILALSFVMVLLSGCERSGDDGGERMSVPECDKLLRTAQACFAKNPVVKANMADSIDEVKSMLRPKEGQPFERGKIADICRQRLSTLEQGCQ